ncbi:MAG: restriction endonuclease subunit S [bacterium]|nr:restriction endonuclease subunit S [bacterium]
MTYPTKKLGEVCDFQNGLWTGKRAPFVMAKVIRNTNFKNNDGTLNLGDVAEIEVEERQLKNRLLEKGDLVLERSGGGPTQPVGRVVYFDEDDEFSFSNFTTRIRVRNLKQLNSVYLWRYLNLLYLSGTTEKMQKQTTGIRNLNFAEYKELGIPLPTIGEQRKIVVKLEGLLRKIKEAKRLREEAQSAAGELLPAELHKIFEEGKKKDWEEKELESVIKMSSGGFLPSSRQVRGSHNVYGGNGVLGTHTEYNREDRTLIIGRVGAHCGVVHITEPKSWITDNALMVTEINREADVDFLAIVLRNKELNQFAKTSAQPSLSQTTINKIKILLPPIAEQKKIVARLDLLSEKIKKLREYQQNTKVDMNNLERSVLHQAFSRE